MNWVSLLGAAGICAMLGCIATGACAAARSLAGLGAGRYQPAFWTLCGILALTIILRAGLV